MLIQGLTDHAPTDANDESMVSFGCKDNQPKWLNG